MTWLELDDRILEHPKFIRAVKLAGSEAIHLWLGIRAYCGQNLTNGFVPDDMLDEVRGPSDQKRRSKALEALKTVRSLDQAEGGIQMQNYLKWSSSRDDVLRRREAARERKQRSRGPSAGSHAVTDAERTSESRRDGRRTDVGVRSPSQTPARADPLPLPSPPDPDPTTTTGSQARQDDRASGTRPVAAVVIAAKTSCPKDLVLTDDQRSMLEVTPGIPGWAIDELTAKFVGKALGDPDDLRPLATWRKCLSAAVCGDWGNARTRPKKPVPEAAQATDDTDGYGRSDEWAV